MEGGAPRRAPADGLPARRSPSLWQGAPWTTTETSRRARSRARFRRATPAPIAAVSGSTARSCRVGSPARRWTGRTSGCRRVITTAGGLGTIRGGAMSPVSGPPPGAIVASESRSLDGARYPRARGRFLSVLCAVDRPGDGSGPRDAHPLGRVPDHPGTRAGGSAASRCERVRALGRGAGLRVGRNRTRARLAGDGAWRRRVHRGD